MDRRSLLQALALTAPAAALADRGMIAACLAQAHGSGEVLAVPTIDALIGLPSTALRRGQRMAVAGYDARGHGGGVFRWEPDSRETTDGGVVFVPSDLCRSAPRYALEYGHLTNPNGFRQLPHTGIVWGSVAIEFDNGRQRIGSPWLHGHAVTPRHGVRGPVNDRPTLDHETGRLWGSRLAPLIATNDEGGVPLARRTAALTYQYVDQPGRWVRELHGHVTPAMFGGCPADARFDNSFAICWALNWLGSQPLIKRLKFDGNYFVKGFWGEVYSGVTLEGMGPETPCVSYFGDQGGGSGGVADFLKEIYLNSAVNQGNRDPYFLLRLFQTGHLQFDNATGFGHVDMCIDGRAEENLYFLSDTSGAFDTRRTGTASKFLRESPMLFGFFVTTQSGRYIARNTRWTANRVTIRNMLGSCYTYANGGFLDANDLRLGNSVSGRVFYGGQGNSSNVTLFGYTRSSFWTPNSGRFSNVIIRDAAPNPWPQNSEPYGGFVMRGEIYPGFAAEYYKDEVALERFMGFHAVLQGFTFDFRNVGVSTALRCMGGQMDVANGSILGPATGHASLLDVARSRARCSLTSIRYRNASPHGVTLVDGGGGKGYWDALTLTAVQVEDTVADGVKVSEAGYQAGRLQGSWCTISQEPSKDLPRIVPPQQRLTFVDCIVETAMQFLIVAHGATNPHAVPTAVVLRGGSIANVSNKLINSVSSSLDLGTALRVEMENFELNTFDPHESRRGNEDVGDAWIKVTTMRGCRTPDGRRSEFDKVVRFRIVDGMPAEGELQAGAVNAAGFLEVDLGLLWKPMTWSATPVSADAMQIGVREVAPAYPPSKFNPSRQNPAAPRLRIRVGPVKAGQQLAYAVRAAVAPPR